MEKLTYSEEQQCSTKANEAAKPPSKIARVLKILLAGTSINRFEAERIGDHCLHSTISVLANRYGLAFERQQERVLNHWGTPCSVTRYSLPNSQREWGYTILRKLTHVHAAREE